MNLKSLRLYVVKVSSLLGSSTSGKDMGKDETGDKAFTFGDARRSRSGPLSCSRVPRAQLPRPIRVRPACWSSHESHRRALELQRAAVGGAPSVRSSVHPPATLEYEQMQQPVMVAMAGGHRHHPGGARNADPSLWFAMAGAACAHCPARSHTAQPDCSLRSACGRSSSGTAFQPPFDACNVASLGEDLQQSRSLWCAPCADRGVDGGAL